MYKRCSLVFGLGLLSLLMSCEQLSTHSERGTGLDETALFTSKDLQSASSVAILNEHTLIGTDLDNETDALELPTEVTPDAADIGTQAVLPNVGGWLVTYRVNSAGTYQIRLYDQSNDAGVTVWAGPEAVQSVAVNAAGSLVAASILDPVTANHDIYLFDLVNGSSSNLSSTTARNEIDVSITASGDKVAYGRETSSGDLRPYICDYDAVSESCTNLSNLSNFRNQYQPSLSANGKYMALIEERPNERYRVRVYDFETNSYTDVQTRSDELEHPSVDNSGKQVMFLRKRDTSGTFSIRLKDLAENTVRSTLNDSVALDHPYITSAAEHFVYGVFSPSSNTRKARTRDLLTGDFATPQGGDWNYFSPFWMWQDNTGSNYSIDMEYSGSGMTASRRAIFESAAARWSSIIIGDLPDYTFPPNASNPCGFGSSLANVTVDDLKVFVSIVPIDGPGNVLGSAGPSWLRSSALPIIGCVELDEADVASLEANGSLYDVILHELGHVIGIGTIWDNVNLSDCPESFGFTGAAAKAEYQALGGSGNVPIENNYGPGTRCGHWDEEVFFTELMTGFLNGGYTNPLSRMTIASLADVGYEVDIAQAEAYSLPPCSPNCFRLTDQALSEHWERIILPSHVVTEGGEFIPLDR